MENKLNGMKIAILVADGFEQIELVEPCKALQKAGAKVDVISPAKEKVQGWNHDKKADLFEVNVALDDADANDYDALMLPGGVMNPDALRLQPKAIDFIKQIAQAKKPIAAICHAPWTLINAEVVKGKKVTSWPSLKIDLINAGANWIDEAVVCDGLLVTSRKPQDIPVFNEAMIKLFAESN